MDLESLSRISFNDSFIYGHIFLQNTQESDTLTLIVCSKITRIKSILNVGETTLKF